MPAAGTANPGGILPLLGIAQAGHTPYLGRLAGRPQVARLDATADLRGFNGHGGGLCGRWNQRGSIVMRNLS